LSMVVAKSAAVPSGRLAGDSVMIGVVIRPVSGFADSGRCEPDGFGRSAVRNCGQML
jgi:hypothetical protein